MKLLLQLMSYYWNAHVLLPLNAKIQLKNLIIFDISPLKEQKFFICKIFQLITKKCC